MSNETMVTFCGNVGADPSVREVGDTCVTNLRVAVTPRRLRRETGEWADAETQWFTVTCWRSLAEHVGKSVRRGDPVVVHGRLNARSYVNKDSVPVSTFEVEASIVGHDLNRGTTHFSRAARSVSTSVSSAPESGDGQEAGLPEVSRGVDPFDESGQSEVSTSAAADSGEESAHVAA